MMGVIYEQHHNNSQQAVAELQPNLTPVGFDNNIGLHTHISRAAPPYKPCCVTQTLNLAIGSIDMAES